MRRSSRFWREPLRCSFPWIQPEPFGLVMIEAMACGTPVIAFRSGSVPEVIDEGVSGFVVDDEEQAVQAVKRLANSIGGGCASGSRNASRQDGWP